jgi:hypothetical protein
MSKRLIVLLLVLVGVWTVAIYVLFFYQKSSVTAVTTQSREQVLQPLIRRLSDSDIERFRKNVEAPSPIMNVFEPYVLKLDKEQLVRQALSQLQPLSNYKFRGYFFSENENFVMFSNGLVKPVGSTLEDRYLIIHALSFAAIVVDLSTGNLLVVK